MQNAKTKWARITREWGNTSPEDKAQAALTHLNRRLARRGKQHEKPIVIVIKAQGKPLLVLRCGDKFVASFTWDRLQYKVVYGPWTSISKTTLAKRLPGVKLDNFDKRIRRCATDIQGSVTAAENQ